MKKFLVIAPIALIQISSLFAQQQVFDAKRMVLEAFEYSEVKLHDSPLLRQFNEVENYYLATG